MLPRTLPHSLEWLKPRYYVHENCLVLLDLVLAPGNAYLGQGESVSKPTLLKIYMSSILFGDTMEPKIE